MFLFFNKIQLENNSELVKIGKELYEQKSAKIKEILIENIKIDKITKEYITEYKKAIQI